MLGHATAAALIGSLLVGPALPGAESLKPLGKWTVGYEPTMCTLSRSFGSPDHEVVLAFRPYIGSEEEQVAVLLPPVPNNGSKAGRGRILLEPSGRELKTSFASGLLTSGHQRGVNVDIDQASVRPDLATSTVMTIEAADERYAFQMTGTAGALRALKACEDDLLRGWGADPALVIPQAELGKVARLISPEVYPRSAMLRHATGRAMVVVEVAPQGRATACRLVASSGHADLDSASCSVMMQRGMYPKSSQPKRFAVHRINWSLPS